MFSQAIARFCIASACLFNIVLAQQLISPPSRTYLRGSAALQDKSYSEAAEAFLAAEQEAPHATDALLQRARALVHLNAFADAEKSLRGYLIEKPKSVDANYLLGFVLFRENEPRESLAQYTTAAAIFRPTAEDFRIVGLDYVLLNDYPDAIRWLEKAAVEAPRNAEAAYDLGRAYFTQSLFDKAAHEFQRALEIDPKNAKAENNLGLVYNAQNRFDDAESAYRRSIELYRASGRPSEQPYLNLAELLLDHNRVGEALALLETARGITPKSSRLEALRGRGLLVDNRLPDAENAFRAAVAIEPNNGTFHYQLGRVLKREGKPEATHELEQARLLHATP